MFCSNCGSENVEGAKFCQDCGERLASSGKKASEIYGSYVEKPKPSGQSKPNFGIIGKRNIAACVVFSIITCGIYCLYWIYKINEEVNEISNQKDATSGGIVILFGIITCGIYLVYWAYKIGEKLKSFYTDQGSTEGNDLPVLYLILFIANYFVPITSLIGYCLMQDRINHIVE